jgi:AraC-like DNA-binding protein
MTTQRPEPEHTLPASQALQLVELVKRWHVTADELLDELGLSEAALEEPDARISLGTMAALVERARALTGEPGLGYYMGIQKRVSMYGFVGLAAMSARTSREAMELFIQFMPVITTALELRLKVEGSVAALIFDEHGDLGSAGDYAKISLLVGLSQISKTLTGQELKGSVDIALPRPSYFSRFAHLLPSVRFDQPVTQFVFDAASLDLPLIAPDRAALRLARKQCERELLALGFDGAIVDRVRRLLPKPEGFRSIDEVAGALHLSTRTLKRRLSTQQVSFSQLLDQERREKALLMLHSSEITFEDVAERLGYSTVSNFVRAFRRWTGKTPAAYRRAIIAPVELGGR